MKKLAGHNVFRNLQSVNSRPWRQPNNLQPGSLRLGSLRLGSLRLDTLQLDSKWPGSLSGRRQSRVLCYRPSGRNP